MKPDLLIFNQHVAGAGFQVGVDEGMWGLTDLRPERPSWPCVMIWVSAPAKSNAPERYYFRFTLDGYPSTAPSAVPWDTETDQVLEAAKWPKGGSVTNSIFKSAWPVALYAPCDRLAMPGHPNWETEHPDLWWRATDKIEKYLHFIYRNLQSPDYVQH